MVKKITVNCNFSGASQPVAFYIGDSAVERNPIGFQSRWLSETKGGTVPEKLMSSLTKIKKISDEHHIPFEDLYEHVIKEIESGKTLEEITVANKNQTQAVANSEASQEIANNEVSQENNEASGKTVNKES